MNESTDVTALVAAFAAAATEHRTAIVVAPLRVAAQRRFDEVGLPRGLRVAA